MTVTKRSVKGGPLTYDEMDNNWGDLDAKSSGGSLYALKRSLEDGQSCAIQILTDSTGDGTTDWPYILGQQIAASYPNYTVDYVLWNDATQTYGGSTRLQLGAQGERYLDCDTISYGSVLDNATAVGPSTNTSVIDARIKMSATTWAPAAIKNLVALDGGSAPNLGWRFILNAGGALGISWSSTGTGITSMVSTVTTGLAANAVKWVRVVFTPNDGGGNRVAKFYTSDDGATWTQLGTTVTTAGAVTVNNPLPTNGYWLGGIFNSVDTGVKIYAVDVRDGDNGPSLVPFLPEMWNPFSSGAVISYPGSPILTIVCGAHPGANITYLGNATRLPKMIPQYGQLATFLSDGHNEGAASAAWGTLYKAWVDQVRTKLPSSGICLMTQNPETSASLYNRVHSFQRYNILALKSAGYDVLDIWQQFIDAGFPGSLMTDAVHPNVTGSTLWASYVKKRIDMALG